MSIINLLTQKYKSDPIVYGVSLINDFCSAKAKGLSDELAGKQSIYTRNVMQISALSMAFGTFLLGLYCGPFHALVDVSYYTCLYLCVAFGYGLGIAVGLPTANHTKHLLEPSSAHIV